MTKANAQAAPVSASNDFNVPVPQDELDAKPNFLMPVGWYHTTLQGGAQVVEGTNSPDWRGIRVPFSGFTGKDGKTFEKDRNYQITVGSNSEQAKEIGRKQAVELGVAFGLTEDVTVNGKPAKRLTAGSPEELVEQLGAVVGSPCDVYVTVKKRKRDGAIVMRDDNTGPVMDNEISRVAAYGAGK